MDIGSNNHCAMKDFKDIQVGDRVEFKVVVDDNLHSAFAALSGDTSPIHSDGEFCAATPFGQKIGYAFLLEVLLSRLYGCYLPGGSSVCLKQESKFKKPFFIVDCLKVMAEVSVKVDSIQAVEIRTSIFRNDSDECVYEGIGMVQVFWNRSLTEPLYELDGKTITAADFI